MNRLTFDILRAQAFALALIVLVLSTGFTYQRDVCSNINAQSLFVVESQSACCCTASTVTEACMCTQAQGGSCGLSFSKYIQFNFEVPPTHLDESLGQLLGVDSQSRLSVILTYTTLKYKSAHYVTPPPKSSREILCHHSVLLI